MSNDKKFSRNEVSQILKIASELDRLEQPEPEGLTTNELQKLATEVGINPQHIETAIQQMKEDEFEAASQNFIDDGYSYQESRITKEVIDDDKWEEMVTEIRRINGGIGKTSRLGNTYEWEQRKKNTGYLQVSVTPKGDHSRLRINASYNYFSRTSGFLSGIFGFLVFIMLSSSLSVADTFQLILGGFGALSGWGLSRLYLKSWMKRKRSMLRFLTQRLTSILSDTSQESSTKINESEPAISLDRETEDNREQKSSGQRLQDR